MKNKTRTQICAMRNFHNWPPPRRCGNRAIFHTEGAASKYSSRTTVRMWVCTCLTTTAESGDFVGAHVVAFGREKHMDHSSSLNELQDEGSTRRSARLCAASSGVAESADVENEADEAAGAATAAETTSTGRHLQSEESTRMEAGRVVQVKLQKKGHLLVLSRAENMACSRSSFSCDHTEARMCTSMPPTLRERRTTWRDDGGAEGAS